MTEDEKYINLDGKIEIKGTMTVKLDPNKKCKNCGKHTDSLIEMFTHQECLITESQLCANCSANKALITDRLRYLE